MEISLRQTKNGDEIVAEDQWGILELMVISLYQSTSQNVFYPALLRELLPSAKAGDEPSLPPHEEEGAAFCRVGLFKCADDSPHPHWAAWADIGERLDFHQPDAFGTLVLGKAQPQAAAVVGEKRARM